MNRWNILHKNWLLLSHAAMLSLLVVPLRAQPINTLTFKATHNSYACCGGTDFLGDWDNSCPVMHNPPTEQMDDWGVWAFELDFDAVIEGGNTRFIVGHNGSQGEDTWTDPSWGKYLDDFLNAIHNSRSMQFRPVFIYFEKKKWANSSLPWNTLLDDLIESIWGRENIFGPDALKAQNCHWPTVTDLAGKIIPVAISINNNGATETGLHFLGDIQLTDCEQIQHGLKRVGPRDTFDKYTDATEMAAQRGEGQGVILASDQYQEDWSFILSSPPNPLFVQANALNEYDVVNAYGHHCFDGRYPCPPCTIDPTNVGIHFKVHQHGTFRFPYGTVSQAYDKARDFSGWTILINAGDYPETLIIDRPVTLKADGGTVIIGR